MITAASASTCALRWRQSRPRLAHFGVGLDRAEAFIDGIHRQAKAAAQLVGEALAARRHFMRRCRRH
jgi:hypothetical protein